MDFSLPAAIAQLKATVREFVDRELLPYEDLAEEGHGLPPDIAGQIAGRAHDLGLFGIAMPEEVGGAGLGCVAQIAVEEELAKAASGVSTVIAKPSNILLACSAGQRERYLLPAVRGEKRDCFVLTEPDAGSDVRAIRTRATWDGARWILNGTKHFISHGATSDFAIVSAVTASRVTGFLADMGTPGFTVTRVHRTMGHRGYDQAELRFQDCNVGPEQVLGEVGQGFELMRRWLRRGRIMTGARCNGRARGALELGRRHADTGVESGQAIGGFEAIQFMLADSAVELQTSRLLTYFSASRVDPGAPDREVHCWAASASSMPARPWAASPTACCRSTAAGVPEGPAGRAPVPRRASRAHLGGHLRDPADPDRPELPPVRLPRRLGGLDVALSEHGRRHRRRTMAAIDGLPRSRTVAVVGASLLSPGLHHCWEG